MPTATVNGYPASSGSGPVSVLDGSSNLGPGYDGFSVPFGYGGTKWSGLGMTYRVNPDTSDTSSEEALADAGASTWNGDSKFAFTDGGLCSTTAKALDGHNDILWGTGLPSGVLAQATYWYSGSTLTEADIEFNDDYTWSDGTSGSYDIQSIATHELGHTLNLRDLYGPRDTSKVMYGYGSSGVQKRGLDPGDVAGIAWIYGVFVPMSGTMVVNGDAAYTKSTAVTLDSVIVSATQMRFRNQGDAWPAWESYSATKSWTLAAGADGARTVEAQYKDASANVYAQSDSITLDATGADDRPVGRRPGVAQGRHDRDLQPQRRRVGHERRLGQDRVLHQRRHDVGDRREPDRDGRRHRPHDRWRPHDQLPLDRRHRQRRDRARRPPSTSTRRHRRRPSSRSGSTSSATGTTLPAASRSRPPTLARALPKHSSTSTTTVGFHGAPVPATRCLPPPTTRTTARTRCSCALSM